MAGQGQLGTGSSCGHVVLLNSPGIFPLSRLADGCSSSGTEWHRAGVLSSLVLIFDISCLSICLPSFLPPSLSSAFSSCFLPLFHLRPAITFSVPRARECFWVGDWHGGLRRRTPAPPVRAQWWLSLLEQGQGLSHPRASPGQDGGAGPTGAF